MDSLMQTKEDGLNLVRKEMHYFCKMLKISVQIEEQPLSGTGSTAKPKRLADFKTPNTGKQLQNLMSLVISKAA